MLSAYGKPFVLKDFRAGSSAHGLSRVSFARGDNPELQYNEAWLQRLIDRHPEILPIETLEPSLSNPKAICLELPTRVGYVDNVFMTDRGDLVLVECKLWRNPEARRAVVGQIVDYATELSSWDYETLEAAVRRAAPSEGVDKTASLYGRAGSPDSLDEAGFVDAVSRNLHRGRFLLLIVGDGIQEGIQSMTEFLQQHAAMHFTLGVVELAIFTLPAGGQLVQPRILTRTTMIERGVVELSDDRIKARLAQGPASSTVNVPSVRARPTTMSEEMFYEDADGWRAGTAALLKAVIDELAGLGVTTEMLPASLKLNARIGDSVWPLGTISAKEGKLWFESVIGRAKTAGLVDTAMAFYRELACLIEDEQTRREKLNPLNTRGISGLPLDTLLAHSERWVAAIQEYLSAVQQKVET